MTVAGDPLPLVGLVAFDLDGEELGEVAGVYMGPEEPEWAALLLPSGRFVVVPLAEAEIYEDSLDLAFPAALVGAAPLQQRVLLEDFTKSQEDELTAYFSGVPRPGTEVASAPMEQSRQVASTAADRSQEAASTAKRANTDPTGDLLRVDEWSSYVGQDRIKARLRTHIEAAIVDDRMPDHILFEAPPGYGKTSLAIIIADEMGAEVEVLKMPVTTRALSAVLRDWDGGVLVFDEIHRGSRKEQEDLLPLLEEGFVAMPTGRRTYMSPDTTIVGTTTEPDKVIAPLRDRFPIRPRFVDYTDAEMAQIVRGMGKKIKIRFSTDEARALGAACAGTPRQARGLVLAARDLRTTNAAKILDMVEIDPEGLTAEHMHYLRSVDSAGGIGVGLATITTLMQLPVSTIRDLERLLLKRRFLTLENTGRKLTNAGFAKVRPAPRRRGLDD